jgi:hypothetical protein
MWGFCGKYRATTLGNSEQNEQMKKASIRAGNHE